MNRHEADTEATRDLPAPERRLYTLWREIRELQAARDLVDWDEETQLPAEGHGARGSLSATLAGLRHQKLTAPELSEVLAACGEIAPPGSVLEAQVRMARLEVDRAVQVPESLVRALSEHKSRATHAWRRAREERDFAPLQPELEELVRLKRQEARALADGGGLYDALLEPFEPGAREQELAPLFAQLEERLAPLVQAVAESGVTVDESPTRGELPAERQRDLALQLSAAVGFDYDRGRLDLSAHPFCLGIHPTDVRLTWRYDENDFRPAIFGVLHETGHGLYEQGLPLEWDGTPLGQPASLGVHESQSRLWENHVGRSRGFWRWALPSFRRLFPGCEVELEPLWRALHTVQPSLIRVEADEATYNLHILVRFQLERSLIAGDLEVSELPGAWDDLYEELLGIRPPDPAAGVLQDIHWPQALFGYFPTYTLGNLMAAQLYRAAERDLGDLEEAFARGELRPVLEWMGEKIHRQGARWPAPELIERATGEPLSPDPLLDHLERIASDVYGV